MKALDHIKQKIGKSVLNKSMKDHERKKVFHTFNTARTVGILFDATDHQNYETARSFAKFLTDKKIRIFGLGFADSKEVMSFYQYYTGFNFFTIKDSNWQGIPSNHNINDFINEPLDILIDIHLIDNFSLEYINSMSKASFKIGKLNSNTSSYDFMIDISTNPTADYLCEQVKHYLSIINNS